MVEDSESLVDVMAKLRSGGVRQQVKDATGKVTEIVFTSPTEAVGPLRHQRRELRGLHRPHRPGEAHRRTLEGRAGHGLRRHRARPG